MYQKHELFGELSSVDIAETLKACALEQKDEYIEDEADRFRECRVLIEQGRNYKQAAAQFRKQDKLKQEPQKGGLTRECCLDGTAPADQGAQEAVRPKHHNG